MVELHVILAGRLRHVKWLNTYIHGVNQSFRLLFSVLQLFLSLDHYVVNYIDS